MIFQAAAFFGPVLAVFVIYGFDLFSGRKTTITAGFTTVIAGMEMVDFSFLPPEVGQALLPGFAVATLLSNTMLTKRV